MTVAQLDEIGCNNCLANKPCSITGLVVELNSRFSSINQETLGKKDTKKIEKILPLIEKGRECLWLFSKIYFAIRQKGGRNEAEKEIIEILSSVMKFEYCHDCETGGNNCSAVSSAIELNEVLIKKKALNKNHFGMVKEIISKAKNDNSCNWLLARIYLKLSREIYRNGIEEIVLILLNNPMNKSKRQKLLDNKKD